MQPVLFQREPLGEPSGRWAVGIGESHLPVQFTLPEASFMEVEWFRPWKTNSPLQLFQGGCIMDDNVFHGMVSEKGCQRCPSKELLTELWNQAAERMRFCFFFLES